MSITPVQDRTSSNPASPFIGSIRLRDIPDTLLRPRTLHEMIDELERHKQAAQSSWFLRNINACCPSIKSCVQQTILIAGVILGYYLFVTRK